MLGKHLLAVEPVRNVFKDLYVLGKHLYGRLEVAPIKGIGELLC